MNANTNLNIDTNTNTNTNANTNTHNSRQQSHQMWCTVGAPSAETNTQASILNCVGKLLYNGDGDGDGDGKWDNYLDSVSYHVSDLVSFRFYVSSHTGFNVAQRQSS